MAEEKTYSLEEIKKTAPGYKRNLENFDVVKVKSKKGKAASRKLIPKPAPTTNLKPQMSNGKSASPSQQQPPTSMGETPVSHYEEDLKCDKYFSFNIKIVPVTPQETPQENFTGLSPIAREVFKEYEKDVAHIKRQMIPEELEYYATGLL